MMRDILGGPLLVARNFGPVLRPWWQPSHKRFELPPGSKAFEVVDDVNSELMPEVVFDSLAIPIDLVDQPGEARQFPVADQPIRTSRAISSGSFTRRFPPPGPIISTSSFKSNQARRSFSRRSMACMPTPGFARRS